MISTAFYERRKRDLSIDFIERRIIKRRSQRQDSVPERRRLSTKVRVYEREFLPIKVRLQGKGEYVTANAHNISPVGVRISGDVVLIPGTSVALKFYFGDNVSYLCFPGQVIYCRPVNHDELSSKRTIGIRFSLSQPGEDETLISIIQDIRQRATTQQEALVSLIVSEDSLIHEKVDSYREGSSQQGIKSNMKLESRDISEWAKPSDGNDDFCDRRFASRITVALSGNMKFKDPSSRNVIYLPIEMINLSAGGASITSNRLIDISVDAVLELYFPPSSESVRTSGRIVWNHSKIFDPMTNESRFLYGIQFARLGNRAQQQIGQFLSQHMLSREELSERRVTMTIVSKLIRFKNRDGKNIVGFYDHLRDCDTSTNPFILIPPAYGETKMEALSTSYWLVKNGFNVIRYDSTDHVGESDGKIFDTTLTKMKLNLLSALDYIDKLGCEKVGIVTSSLAARVAIRAAVEDQRIRCLICTVPVVNLRHTLEMVYNEDMIGSCLNGRKWDPTNVLGFQVDGKFLNTAIIDDFHDLRSTVEDLRELNIPTMFFVAKNDPWVDSEDVRIAFVSIPTSRKEIVSLPEAFHRLDENPALAKDVQRQIVRNSLRFLTDEEPTDIISPNIREIAIQGRIEKERYTNLKKLRSRDEKGFWSRYLSGFKYIVNIHDYWSLLASISDCLGKTKQGEAIFDAGCGNGSFGAFLLVREMFKNKDNLSYASFPLFSYVGFDFVEPALVEAKSAHENLQLEFIEKLGKRGLVGRSYILGDLNNTLSFKNDSFDKVCCNLVLSYLENPLSALKELIRVLKPGGRLVVTSLKPHADLTVVYRNFVEVAESEEEIEEARKLLNNSGAIKNKETEGYYKFFSQKELIMLIAMAGARTTKTYNALANQAIIILVEK